MITFSSVTKSSDLSFQFTTILMRLACYDCKLKSKQPAIDRSVTLFKIKSLTTTRLSQSSVLSVMWIDHHEYSCKEGHSTLMDEEERNLIIYLPGVLD